MLWISSTPCTLAHAATYWVIRTYLDVDAEFRLEDFQLKTDGKDVHVLGPKTSLSVFLKSHKIKHDTVLERLLRDVELADRATPKVLAEMPALEELGRALRKGTNDVDRICALIENHLEHTGLSGRGVVDREFFQSIVETMPVGAMVLDHLGRVVFANQRMGVLLQSTASSVVGRNIVQLRLDCVDRQGHRVLEMSSVLRLALNRNRPLDRVVTSIDDRQGKPLFLATGFTPLQGRDDLPPRVLVTAVDVTGEVLVEQAFRNSEDRLQYILNSLPYGVMEFDPNGRILYANATLHRTFGYAMGTLIGEPAWFCKSGKFDEAAVQRQYQLLLSEQWAPQFYLATMKTKHGREIQMRVDWDYRRNANMEPVGFIANMTDISEDFMRRSEFLRQLETLKLGGTE